MCCILAFVPDQQKAVRDGSVTSFLSRLFYSSLIVPWHKKNKNKNVFKALTAKLDQKSNVCLIYLFFYRSYKCLFWMQESSYSAVFRIVESLLTHLQTMESPLLMCKEQGSYLY